MGNSSGKDQQLKLKILTGQTQSQQLFDFHSPQKQQSLSNLLFPSIIGYKDGDLIYIHGDFTFGDIHPLYQIQLSENGSNLIIRELFKRTRQLDDTYIWKVLGEGQQMQLHEKDYIKIGKTKIMFKQLIKQTTHIPKKSSYPITDRQQTERMDHSRRTQQILAKNINETCRICFQSTSTLENPLVSLCKCTGSVQYIHYQCLKDWTSNNVKRQQSSNCLFYSYTQPNCCQLCKHPLENQFRYQGQLYKLYQFQKIDPPYAVFENRVYDEQTGKTRVSVYTIYVPENNQITIGRNHTSHVILKDISVSRSHCLIVYKFGSLYIRDKKSKFGTLIRPKTGFCFDSQIGLQLQFQSKIMQISKDKTFKFNSCCLTENSSYYIEINKQANESFSQ